MGRKKALDDIQVRWAAGEWVRGCAPEVIAATLGVSKRTLYRTLKARGYKKPKPIPDKDWIVSHTVTK